MLPVSTQALAVLWAGTLAGAHHALTGPDHLAGVAPFAATQGRRAWRVGVAWGLGHATGAALAAVLALVLRSLIPGVEEHLSSISERLVGVLLCAIGVLGLRTFLRSRIHSHVHEHDGHAHEHFHWHAHAAHEHRQSSASIDAHTQSDTSPSLLHRHRHPAFVVGLFHGAAGLSHLFAVLPALALPGFMLPSLYLGGYALACLLAVTVFASTIGYLDPSGRPNVRRILLGATSGLSLCVGVVWLVHPF